MPYTYWDVCVCVCQEEERMTEFKTKVMQMV